MYKICNGRLRNTHQGRRYRDTEMNENRRKDSNYEIKFERNIRPIDFRKCSFVPPWEVWCFSFAAGQPGSSSPLELPDPRKPNMKERPKKEGIH